MAVDVIEAVLGIILDDEDTGLWPKLAVADRLDDLTDGQIVVGHHGLGRGRARFGAVCVVTRQQDIKKVGQYKTGEWYIRIGVTNVGGRLKMQAVSLGSPHLSIARKRAQK